MNKRMVAVIVGFMMATSGIVQASGPGAFPSPFKDFQYYAEVGEDIGLIPWYGDAAVRLFNMGIVKGYEDGTFKGNNSVNRAELAVMLDRLYNKIMAPETPEWGVYSNDYFSVWYPKIAGTEYMTSDGNGNNCNSFLDIKTDTMYPVTCYDATKVNVDNLIDGIGSQFREGDKRSESRSTFMLNGREATLTTVTTLDHPDWYSQSVFVQNGNIIYGLSNGAIRDPNFELFYRSFKVKG